MPEHQRRASANTFSCQMDGNMQTELIETVEGTFAATFSGKGLARLDFPGTRKIQRAAAGRTSPQLQEWMQITARALEQVLKGKAPDRLPPLDLSSGTPFQQSVWNSLRQIPSGRTRSYGEIARAIRRPKALRAVGQACGANPIPLLLPCHRVLAARGKIGGFSAGLDWKRRLLEREKVDLNGGRSLPLPGIH